MEAYSSNVTAVVDYLQFNRKKMPFLIWRDNTPQHFDTPLGEFGCDGCPEPHVPYQCKVRARLPSRTRQTLMCCVQAPTIICTQCVLFIPSSTFFVQPIEGVELDVHNNLVATDPSKQVSYSHGKHDLCATRILANMHGHIAHLPSLKP